MQCCGSGFGFNGVPESVSGTLICNPDPDPRGKKLPTDIEKVNKFHFLKCWMFSFES
jgi:hypothetical protein